jgi:hypothetical protein
LPGVIRTEVAIVLLVIAVAIGWGVGQLINRKIGLAA